MKKFVMSFMLFLMSFPIFSQQVSVSEETKKADGTDYKGYASKVVFDLPKVEEAWAKEMKKYGKLERGKDFWVLRNGNIPSVSSQIIVVYSKVTAGNDGTTIWVGTAEANEGLKGLLYSFSINMYKNDLMEQLQEAETVLLNTNKGYEKKISEGDNLQKKIAGNKADKLKLEQSLQQNAIDLKQYEADVEKNKLEKQAALDEMEKIKKIIEQKKENLKMVGN